MIGAKLYRSHINPQHIRNFHRAIGEEAPGGFFVYTGKTRELSNQLLREGGITLISGQRLVNLVLGQQLRIVGKDSCFLK